MKKMFYKTAVVTICFLLLCVMLSACSNNGYAGTYEAEKTIRHNIAMPTATGTFRVGPEILDGKSKIVLNGDGTGIYTFTIDQSFDPTKISGFNKAASANNLTAIDITNYLSSLNYVIYEGSVTWEEVEGLLYISGTIPAKDESGESIEVDLQCELKGKTLMKLDGESSGYVKVG